MVRENGAEGEEEGNGGIFFPCRPEKNEEEDARERKRKDRDGGLGDRGDGTERKSKTISSRTNKPCLSDVMQ